MNWRMIAVATIAGSILLQGPASAMHGSDEDKLKAEAVIAAFRCSMVAQFAAMPEEQERLFRFAYSDGVRVFGAVRQGHIPRALASWGDWSTGPSVDFALGRVYHETARRYLVGAFETGLFDRCGENCKSGQIEALASDDFLTQNCAIIGR